MIFSCCDEHRKAAVLGNPTINGIDYLEVLDHQAPPGSPPQQTLFVYCLKTAPANLSPSNVLIAGGESITGITASWIAPASAPPPQASPAEAAYFATLANPANILVIRTSVAGDFSPYTLRLVNNAAQAAADAFELTETLTGFDPQLAEVTFSFKVECGPNFDCKPSAADCPPELPTPPPINYLAKDYGSFRTVLLDRLHQLLPSWQGSSEADPGVVLAELIAYAADQLSYHQDAVTTEAYLGTARSRISLRRHALLVDYRVHDGCNARAWVCLTVSAALFLDHRLTRFYTFAPGMPSSLAVGAGTERAALDAGVIVFEPMQDANLFPEHNQMQFYTWGDSDCCLPRGATEATLLGTYANLQIGDVLIFQEMIGPQTGAAADADIRHRCAVRLTSVATRNGQGDVLVDPLFEAGTGAPITSAAQQPTPVTEIRWSVGRRAAVSGLHLVEIPELERRSAVAHRCKRGLWQRRARRPGALDIGGGAAGGAGAKPVSRPIDQRPLQPHACRRLCGALSAAGARQPGYPGRAIAARRQSGDGERGALAVEWLCRSYRR